MQTLFFVVGVFLVYCAAVEFKRRGPKQLSPWSYLAIGLANMGIAPGVLFPIGIVLWVIEFFRNRTPQQIP